MEERIQKQKNEVSLLTGLRPSRFSTSDDGKLQAKSSENLRKETRHQTDAISSCTRAIPGETGNMTQAAKPCAVLGKKLVQTNREGSSCRDENNSLLPNVGRKRGK